KITIVGTGYVGLSNAVLLSRKNNVIALDIIPEKVEMINNKKSPIVDDMIERYLVNEKLDLYATTNKEIAYKQRDIIIIATPTNYDSKLNYFDTSSVDQTIEDVFKVIPTATVIIKSTVP